MFSFKFENTKISISRFLFPLHRHRAPPVSMENGRRGPRSSRPMTMDVTADESARNAVRSLKDRLRALALDGHADGPNEASVDAAVVSVSLAVAAPRPGPTPPPSTPSPEAVGPDANGPNEPSVDAADVLAPSQSPYRNTPTRWVSTGRVGVLGTRAGSRRLHALNPGQCGRAQAAIWADAARRPAPRSC